jgi:hypothetical protein
LFSSTTDTPLLTGTLNVPLAPLTVTKVGVIVAVTPCGRGTGLLATRDMSRALELQRDR